MKKLSLFLALIITVLFCLTVVSFCEENSEMQPPMASERVENHSDMGRVVAEKNTNRLPVLVAFAGIFAVALTAFLLVVRKNKANEKSKEDIKEEKEDYSEEKENDSSEERKEK